MLTLERFWNKVDVRGPAECWPWHTASENEYGKFSVKRPPFRQIGSHVFSWIIANRSDVPEGCIILHSCDFKKCVNPAHLSAGTYSQNTKEAVERGLIDMDIPRSFRKPSDYCQRGHALEDNHYIQEGRRRCKTCHATRALKYRDKYNAARRRRRARERAEQ